MAAIDIGTNSCRLLVSRIHINAQRRSHLRVYSNPIQWRSIDSFCRIVKLGEDLKKTGKMSEKSIQKTLEALHACYKKICYYRVSHLRVIATEACRKAQNAGELVQRARELYNLSIEIVSGEEEAQLALLGCCEIFDWKKPYAIVFDIGGGSTEVALIKLNPSFKQNYLLNAFYEIIDSISLPFGVVTVNDNLDGYATKEKIFEYVRQKIFDNVKYFYERNNAEKIFNEDNTQLIGSSGTVTAFAAIHLGLIQYDRKKVDGLTLQAEDVLKLCHSIGDFFEGPKNMDDLSCTRNPDLMNVGSGILAGILDSIPIKTLTVADRGVREGMIVDLIRQYVIPRFQIINNKTITAQV